MFIILPGAAGSEPRRGFEVRPQTSHVVYRGERQDAGGSTVCFRGTRRKGNTLFSSSVIFQQPANTHTV